MIHYIIKMERQNINYTATEKLVINEYKIQAISQIKLDLLNNKNTPTNPSQWRRWKLIFFFDSVSYVDKCLAMPHTSVHARGWGG